MPKSIYEDIFIDLKNKIEQKEYEYGSLLPSENELIKVYACSRNTIRRAISKLTNMGYTQPIHGKGVHIIYAKTNEYPQFFDLNSIDGLGQSAKKHGFIVENEVLDFSVLKVNEHLSKKSGFTEGVEVYFIQRLRKVDGVNKMLDNTFLRKDMFPNLKKENVEKSLFDYIEKKTNIIVQTIKRNITIERATSFDEKHLHLDGYNCLAIINSNVYSADGIQIEYTESRNRPDLFAYNTVVTRNK